MPLISRDEVSKVLADRQQPGSDLALWDRMPRETDGGWDAFQVYRDLGRNRTLAKVEESPKVTLTATTIATYAALFAWSLRAAAWDTEQDRLVAMWMADERRKAAQRHVRQAQALANKALQRLQSLDPEKMSASEVLRYIEVTMKMEREALGFAQALDVQVSGSLEVTHLSPEDTKMRLATLQREIQARLAEDDPDPDPDPNVIDAEVVPDDE